MRTILFLSAVLLFGLASCNNPTSDRGVVINDVRWATRNVDAPGTFARSPQDFGMFFHWNRRQGWAVIGTVGHRDGSTGTAWYTDNNPCPPGWRVPTQAEFQSLVDAGSEWRTRSGVNGRLFGSGRNQIFLPAAGIRQSNNDEHLGGDWSGYYWSSTYSLRYAMMFLSFTNNTVYATAATHDHSLVFNVRCVAE